MKKQILILSLLVFHFPSRSQTSITTEVPCTDALAQNAKGKWIGTFHESASKSNLINKNLAEFHKMMMDIYPRPTGVDVAWHTVEGISYFGTRNKNSPYPDGSPRYEATELPHFRMYYYKAGFFRYLCEYQKTHSLIRAGETGTWVTIWANQSQPAISEAPDASWTINGFPVRTLNPGARTFSGDKLRDAVTGRNYRMVLIHRKGILPYIPVTRKQYLEQCIRFHTKMHDDMIRLAEQMAIRTLDEQEKEKKAKLAKFEKDFGKDPKRLKSAVDYYLSGYKTDQEIRDEQVEKTKKIKAQALKKFSDELENTTKQGLLDTPAMIREMYNSDLIFDADPLQAETLVIENRDYIRKDLPKHVPQLFVIEWVWNNWAPQEKIDQIMENNFPFEKLHAMIDK